MTCLNPVVIASSNSGKLKEFEALLTGLFDKVCAQSEFGLSAVPETGASFVENALIKARAAAEVAGLPVIADDSGLVVDALGGAPGLYSARYAGPNSDPQACMTQVLNELKAVPEKLRTAHFHCTIVLLNHPTDPDPLICQGRWTGNILFKPQGTYGFGYDPIFYVPEYKCSAAELKPDIKNIISHRGRAIRQLLHQLPTLMHGRYIKLKS